MLYPESVTSPSVFARSLPFLSILAQFPDSYILEQRVPTAYGVCAWGCELAFPKRPSSYSAPCALLAPPVSAALSLNSSGSRMWHPHVAAFPLSCVTVCFRALVHAVGACRLLPPWYAVVHSSWSAAIFFLPDRLTPSMAGHVSALPVLGSPLPGSRGRLLGRR